MTYFGPSLNPFILEYRRAVKCGGDIAHAVQSTAAITPMSDNGRFDTGKHRRV
jgi:hypothetical protein